MPYVAEKPDYAFYIGELAKLVSLPVSTIRYYTKLGLIHPLGKTPGGLSYYSPNVVEQLKRIKWLKEPRTYPC